MSEPLPSGTPTPSPARPPIWQAAVGLAISAGLLWWSLRGVHFADVVQHLEAARPWPIALGLAIATIPFGLRVFRWRLLLRAEDGGSLPVAPLWHAVAMGFMANNVLPLRMGEVVRTFAASKLTGARFSSAFASIAVERLFDALAVVLLLGLGLLMAGLPTDALVGGVRVSRVVTVAGLLAFAGLAVAALVVAFPQLAERIIGRLVPWPRLRDRLIGLIEGVIHGLSALQSPSRVLAVGAWSLAIWLLSGLSFYVMFAAFDIRVNFAGALLMQGLIMFGIAVPSTPGYLGVFEAPIIAVLGLYAIPASLAATYAFVYHFTTFLPITLLGAWSVARTNLGLRQLRGPSP